MKRVLITGATGFLGGHTVTEFSKHGYHVIATGRDQEKLTKLKPAANETIACDLSSLAKKRLRADAVVHIAALSTIWGSWADFYNANVLGTQQVIQFCKKNGIKKLVFISSPSIYSGRQHRLNIHESAYNPKNKLNNYIRSKIVAEKLVQAANDKKLQTVILRPRGIFGIGDTSIVPRLIKANNTIGLPLTNNGQNQVDMTCVENVAHAIRLAVESKKANGHVYNITNGEPRTFKDITGTLFKEINQKPRYKRLSPNSLYVVATVLEHTYRLLHIPNEPPVTRYTVCTLGYSQTLDISSARKDLGYAPIIGLNTGLKKYADDYKKNN
jgi:nucleoside-diphosphate-sugar epimerase